MKSFACKRFAAATALLAMATGSLYAQEMPDSSPADSDRASILDNPWDQIRELEQSILSLEQSSDAFDPRIGELNRSLANRLSTMEMYETALEAIRRADQNLKVNQGLYAPEREPLIRMAHEQLVLMRDIDAAEAELEHLAWLVARSVDAGDPRYIEPLIELSRWHFSRYLAEVNDESLTQLETSVGYLEDARELYLLNGLPYSLEFVDLYVAVNKSSSEFLPRVQVSQTVSESSRFDRDRIQLERLVGDLCDLGYFESEEDASRCERAGEAALRRHLQISPELDYYESYNLNVNHTALFVNRSYQRGRRVLEELYEQSLAENDPLLHVQTLLRMADWFLLFDHESSAREVYQAAAETAQSMGLAEHFQLDRPRPIPPNAVYDALVDLSEQPVSGSVSIRADIDADGNISQLRLATIDMEDSAEAGRIASQVVRTRFRPALVDGAPVDYENYEFNVHL